MSPTTREGGRRAPSRVALVLRSRTTQGFLFTAPLLVLFAAFVIYPMAFGVWYALDADSYRALFSDPTFRQTVVNTLWYVGFAVNVDRKSTRLNSSHDQISYAVFCLKKKKK